MINIKFSSEIEKHESEISSLMFRLYAEDPEGEPLSIAKVQRTFQECLLHPEKTQIIAIKAADEVIGYGLLIFVWSNEFGGNVLHIDELYLSAPYQNLGIGSDFFRHIALYKNIVALQIETTPSNLRAGQFYLRQGFIPVLNQSYFRFL